MANITIPQAQAELQGKQREQEYFGEFLKWKGFYDEIPLLKSVIDAKADAVTASWRTYGKKGKKMAEILDGFDGNGKETFKGMMNNAVKTFTIGGDCFFEIVADSDLNIENIMLLPPENIKIVIRNGKIKRYKEIDDGTSWKPEEILHFGYNPVGAMCHGQSSIKPMNDLLLALRQIQDDMRKIYHKYVKPIHIVELDTDDATEIASFKADWAKLLNVPEADIIIPKGFATVSRAGIPQYSTLDPSAWHKILVDQLIMAERVPELALGTGSVNSDESAKMQFDGFRQLVRWNQRFIEECCNRQLFNLQFPDETPTIKFSFAAEPQEEKYNRLLNSYSVISASPIADEIKGEILVNILSEMGLIPDE